MEKYQGRELLPSLCNEKVYLVTTTDSYQDPCVLKLIECIDHSHATEVLTALNKLNTIRHHSVLSYRDLFLQWDQSESSLYVVVVADFQKGGSLNDFIGKQAGQPVSEEKIRRWTAQLIDALITIHGHEGQSHNNVKTTNVYLGESETAILGDALPLSALLYRKNRKFITDKTAPKPQISIGEFEDIHAIAKVALELTTPGTQSGHVYSAELMEAILLLMNTTQSLSKLSNQNNYLKSALQSIGSRHAPPTPLQTWPHARIRVPTELGVPGILSYMDSHRMYSDCLQAALAELARIFSQTPHALATVDAPLLLNILDSAAASPEVQTTTFNFMCKLRFNVEPALFVRLLSDSFFAYATRIFSANANAPEVVIAVSEFFCALAEDSRVAHRLVSSGLVPVLVDGLRQQLAKKDGADNSLVLTEICQTIFRLAVADNLAAEALKIHTLQPLVECVQMPNIRLKRSALAAMVCLAMEPESPKLFVNTRAFETVAITLCHHYNEPEITQLSCTILSSLVAPSAECALSLLLLPTAEVPDEETGLLGVVLSAYRAHADHGSVVEACAQLMAAFSHHPEIVAEFANCGNATETVDEIARRYRDRTTIVDACKLMQNALKTHKTNKSAVAVA